MFLKTLMACVLALTLVGHYSGFFDSPRQRVVTLALEEAETGTIVRLFPAIQYTDVAYRYATSGIVCERWQLLGTTRLTIRDYHGTDTCTEPRRSFHRQRSGFTSELNDVVINLRLRCGSPYQDEVGTSSCDA